MRRRLMVVSVVSAFYFGCLIYPVLRAWHWLAPEQPPGTLALLLLIVAPLALRIVHPICPEGVRRIASMLSLTWLGVYFELFLIVLGIEILRLAIPLADHWWGAIAIGALAAVVLYSLVNAQRIKVREIRLPGRAGAAGNTLAQISDVHVGSRRPGHLARIVRRVKALAPSAVVITGDLVDTIGVSAAELAPLGTLEAPTYFIIGNHERYEDLEAILERLKSHGVRVLRNEAIDAAPFQFIGIDDEDAHDTVRRGLANIDPMPDRHRVLLYHRPLGAADAASWGAHLMLCGHTHKGQIFPFNLIVERLFPRTAGGFVIDGLHLHVNTGSGTWGPVLRLGSHNEITRVVFT